MNDIPASLEHRQTEVAGGIEIALPRIARVSSKPSATPGGKTEIIIKRLNSAASKVSSCRQLVTPLTLPWGRPVKRNITHRL